MGSYRDQTCHRPDRYTAVMRFDLKPPRTLDDCHAVEVFFAPRPGEYSRSLIVWRHQPSRLRAGSGKRVRDLQPGDRVTFRGHVETVLDVQVYR